MLLLLLQIILTITAWQKGWRWTALLPLGIALGIGFIIGLSVGESGGSISDVQGLTIFLDICAVVALGVMCYRGPKVPEVKETFVEDTTQQDIKKEDVTQDEKSE